MQRADRVVRKYAVLGHQRGYQALGMAYEQAVVTDAQPLL